MDSSQSGFIPCCLTIAGSDSGGNAGVQADLRAFHSYGVHGCTVFAALTAQNPSGVYAVHSVPADFVAAQLDAVLGVYSIRALKTGMLSDPAVIAAVADRIARLDGVVKVVDPVMVATSGSRLASDAAVEAMVSRLLPLATLVTPNLPEAEVLCGRAPSSARSGDVAYAESLARRIYGTHGCAVLVKGGHGANAEAVDVLFDGREIRMFSMPWVANPVSTHGTGCTLAAALAAELALGCSLAEAVDGAKRHVHAAISGSCLVGPGCGVLGFVSPSVLSGSFSPSNR